MKGRGDVEILNHQLPILLLPGWLDPLTFWAASRSKLGLLLSTLGGLQVCRSVLGVELNTNLASHIGGAAVQTSGLDTRHIGHDLQLGVQAGSTVAAEEVLVNLARVANGIVGLGGPWG